mmetsp:Transcript_17461/g.22224  ORF Transcript_17461/g.22224 Transcript_17461/m.22224 type:complete len:202 (+) Transcript_17461:69-674(+)
MPWKHYQQSQIFPQYWLCTKLQVGKIRDTFFKFYRHGPFFKWQQITFQVSASAPLYITTLVVPTLGPAHSQSSKVALALDEPNAPADTSVAPINDNPSSSTPLVPLLPASPSNTYLLSPNIKDTYDCAALDVSPLISSWAIHHPTLPTFPQHCIGYFNNVPCVETCLCNEASKGRHNAGPLSKILLQLPLPCMSSFIWLLR